jgi:hypothetical protein
MEIFPTAYFGSIYYFKLLYQSQQPLIEAHEHFIKQTVRTRCTILGAKGIQRLSVPVIRKNGSKTEIDEVTIGQTEKWQKDHWKSIESAYASSPFFDAYDQEIKTMIYQQEENLIVFNKNVTQQLFELLDLNKEIDQTAAFIKTPETVDFRSFDFESSQKCKSYIQVFASKENFVPNLSILDLLFCEGPMARNWIVNSH